MLKIVLRNVQERRKRGRAKTRWKDACHRDLKSTRLRAGDETDVEKERRSSLIPATVRDWNRRTGRCLWSNRISSYRSKSQQST